MVYRAEPFCFTILANENKRRQEDRFQRYDERKEREGIGIQVPVSGF
jgi:hypothetical protein